MFCRGLFSAVGCPKANPTKTRALPAWPGVPLAGQCGHLSLPGACQSLSPVEQHEAVSFNVGHLFVPQGLYFEVEGEMSDRRVGLWD